MPQFFRVSPGADIPGRTRIAEQSTLRLREDAEKRQIAEEKRRRAYAEEDRALAEEATQSDYLSKLEQASDELGLNVPYKRTTSRVTAPAFSPLAERIKAEQGYQRLSTPERIRYLEDRVKPAVKERGGTQLSEEAQAYGITEQELSQFTTPKGKQAFIESKKKAFTADEKARREGLKEQESTKQLIGWMGANIGKTYNRGTALEYTLDTPEEAVKVLQSSRKRELSQTEINAIYSYEWPASGVDELGPPTEEARAGRAEELDLVPTGVSPEGVAAFGRPPKEVSPKETPEARLKRIEEESRVRGKVGKEFETPKESPDIAEMRRLQSSAVKAGLGELEGATLVDVRKSYMNKLNELDNEKYTDALIKEILEDKKMWKRFKKNEQLFKDNGANVDSIKKTIKARKGWS